MQDSKTEIFPKDKEEKKGFYLERKGCTHLSKIWFSSDICPRVGLLDHMVALFLAFKVTSVLSSIMAAPIYIPTSRIGGFPFHHTLSNTYCLYIFKKIYIYFGHVHTTAFIYYVFIFGCSGSSLLHAGSLVVSRGCL